MAENRFITPIFRVSFPNLAQPRAAEAGAEPKYSLTMLFKKGDPLLKDIKAACEAAARAKWGAKYDSIKARLRMPFRDGMEKGDYDGYGEGVEFASASSKRLPGLADEKGQRLSEPGRIYPGCFCRASLVPFAYDNKSAGVSLGLRNVQFVADGDRLDGGIAPEAEFDAVTPADDDMLG